MGVALGERLEGDVAHIFSLYEGTLWAVVAMFLLHIITDIPPMKNYTAEDTPDLEKWDKQ